MQYLLQVLGYTAVCAVFVGGLIGGGMAVLYEPVEKPAAVAQPKPLPPKIAASIERRNEPVPEQPKLPDPPPPPVFVTQAPAPVVAIKEIVEPPVARKKKPRREARKRASPKQTRTADAARQPSQALGYAESGVRLPFGPGTYPWER